MSKRPWILLTIGVAVLAFFVSGQVRRPQQQVQPVAAPAGRDVLALNQEVVRLRATVDRLSRFMEVVDDSTVLIKAPFIQLKSSHVLIGSDQASVELTDRTIKVHGFADFDTVVTLRMGYTVPAR